MSVIVTHGYGNSGAGIAFVINSIQVYADHVVLNMSNTPALSGVAADYTRWGLSSLTGYASTVTAVKVVGASIEVWFTPQTNGATYQLTIPTAGFIDVSGNYFGGTFSPTYTASGTGPSISAVRVRDARTIDVFFSEQVNPTDASNLANYSANNGLAILGVQYVSPFQVTLTTSKQTPSTNYSLTASNIRDIAGNVA